MSYYQKLCLAGVFALCAAAPALAADEGKTYELILKDHRFEPAEIKIPAGKPATLHVKNLDNTPEEFDSDDLKTEKVITGNSDVIIHLNPLDVGKYKFEGEYHDDTAQGVVIVQ